MTETVYNLFLIYQDQVCSQVRYVEHKVSLSDEEAVNFLLRRVPVDFNNSIAVGLTRSFTKSQHDARVRLGHGQLSWEEVFVLLKAGERPLSVVTPVVNGELQVAFKTQLGDPGIYLRRDMIPGLQMDDWTSKYMKDGGLQLSQLINDDYFKAIRLTFNAKLYVSAMKLLLIAIDSLSYIEFGEDGTNVFTKWVNTYADLKLLGITADELWELRNGLLHMTNLDSRAVDRKKARRISFYVGQEMFYEHDGIHFFSFHQLLVEVDRAHVRWLQTYNQNTAKRADFVSRYDKTISDVRTAHSKFGTRE